MTCQVLLFMLLSIDRNPEKSMMNRKIKKNYHIVVHDTPNYNKLHVIPHVPMLTDVHNMGLAI